MEITQVVSSTKTCVCMLVFIISCYQLNLVDITFLPNARKETEQNTKLLYYNI